MPLSPIFELADRFIDEQSALDPCMAMARGIPGHDDRLTDYSPDGQRQRADHLRAALSTVNALPVTNEHDRLAKDFISERFQAMLMADDAGEWMRSLRAIASPVTVLRSTFDLMPKEGDEAWRNVAARLEAMSAAIAQLRATYEHGRTTGALASRRQALATADQCQTWATNRWFDSLPTEAQQQQDVDETLLQRLRDGADAANDAYAGMAQYLRDVYAPDADPRDGCGLERYRIGVRAMLGAELDPDEMYEWAWGEFHRLRDEIIATCERIRPGAAVAEVVHLLETDPDRCEHGVGAYQQWLQSVTDDALARCKDHFDIPAEIDRCEALIPPEGSAAAAYYTAPSEDFTRPGRTWYPALGRELFPRWGEVTTCYHESVPGHHLQIGYAKVQAQSLSRIQRTSFIPGHGEGWALYAEQLCDEFGWFDNPDYRLGFLSGQMLRAVRVIVDIGMHLGKRIPDGTTLNDGTPFHGGEIWNADLALAFAISETGHSADFMRSEIDRYLGWPAQAISYKIGQREWVAARDDARRRLGAEFDLKGWHTAALRLGPIGLAQLRSELLRS